MTEGSDWTDSALARLRFEGLDHLARLRSGEATDRDAAAFLAWRGTSQAHEEAFRAAVRLTRLVKRVEPQAGAGFAAPEGGPNANVISLRLVSAQRVSRRAFVGGAIAASVAGGILLLGRSLDFIPSAAALAADYRTGPGERRLIRLAGGATAELNTRTSADLHDGLGMPAIELISGEAIVANGRSARAAVVAGRGTSIVAAGRLNARRDGDKVCITCLDGRAEIAWADQKRSLKAADEVRYDDDGIGSVKPGVDPAVLTAWQSGTLIFHDMPMREVVKEIDRYRAGKIYLASNRLETRRLSGTYYVDRLNDFFSQAELGLGVKVTRLPGDIVILS